MDRKYNLKLDLQFKCNNSTMKFNQFDNNTSDFFMRITNSGKLVDIEKAIVVLAVIKPSGKVASQFIEVKNDIIYADLKSSMKDEIGIYTAKAMLILEDERVVTDPINYEVEEDKIFSLLNDTVEATEDFTLLTDMLNRLSIIEISEEQRQINEAERILSEENRKIEEAKRVEAELIRQHEEADRTKYDAIRESNENIRKQNESTRLANETNRIDEEAKRVDEENKRKLAEEERNANYNFMTEDEERRRLEANAHKEAEALRVQAETNRVNEEAKRRTTEQGRVSAENIRVSNENIREANEVVRKNNENQRVEAETQRQNRYNSFIADAEANANEFENYTNTAKVKEEERKANELDRKSQEDRRISNENERIANENIRKANEVIREENETSRQDVFENKVNEVDEKISEINTTKDNFISSINTKVDNKISEIDNAKTDMSNTVSNKVNEVENRFNALTSSQQQDAEVIDARDGETSLKARLDRDIEKAKQVYVNVEGSNISTDSSSGYAKDVEILGNTIQDASNLADIRSVGDTVEGQELYEIPVLSTNGNMLDVDTLVDGYFINQNNGLLGDNISHTVSSYIKIYEFKNYIFTENGSSRYAIYDKNKNFIRGEINNKFTTEKGDYYVRLSFTTNVKNKAYLNIGTEIPSNYTYIKPQEDKLTILSPVQLEKVGNVRDRIIEKDGVWGVEKNVVTYHASDLTWASCSAHENIIGISTIVPHSILGNSSKSNKELMCNLLSTKTHQEWNSETVGIHKHPSNSIIYVNLLKSTYTTTQSAIDYVVTNGMYFKAILAQPHFIPLPHDQQIKLRTFANKTNISFLTEIEGTIKAQVPKSLGATVNTHTEQIRSLNNELNRVKKLEESTVSTVITESDFTTVEATSNGYFEDVKLEGKTLVNLSDINAFSISGAGTTVYTGIDKIKPNTTYTRIVYITKNTLVGTNDQATVAQLTEGTSVILSKDIQIARNFVGLLECSKYTISDITKGKFSAVRIFNVNTGGVLEGYEIILEGDHTQNPPSYFEGLKSVGQSASEDGTDEIVVSSVNDEKRIIQEKTFATKIELVFDRIYTDCTIYNVLDKPIKITNWNGESWVKDIIIPAKSSVEVKFEQGITNINSIIASFDDGFTKNDFDLLKSVIVAIHQSDKKRLLYYNNETQTWEKPILRQWDSIEKHADGKYYYHQRSGEVVLNGSESWVYEPSYTNDSVYGCYMLKSHLNMKNFSATISDIFNVSNGSTVIDIEGINVNTDVLGLRISKSKLPSQDVQGFKQWLQANNVTVVYQLEQEKVYECTNIDLITYANETSFIVESGAIVPRTTLKVHNNISNVVSLLQKKVSLLESNITSYMITQNRLMLASRYNADNVTFKVDYPSMMSEREVEIDYDLFKLIQDNIIVGPENYDVDKMLEIMDLYAMIGFITWEMWDYLYEVIDSQINPVIEDLEGTPEI